MTNGCTQLIIIEFSTGYLDIPLSIITTQYVILKNGMFRAYIKSTIESNLNLYFQ